MQYAVGGSGYIYKSSPSLSLVTHAGEDNGTVQDKSGSFKQTAWSQN